MRLDARGWRWLRGVGLGLAFAKERVDFAEVARGDERRHEERLERVAAHAPAAWLLEVLFGRGLGESVDAFDGVAQGRVEAVPSRAAVVEVLVVLGGCGRKPACGGGAGDGQGSRVGAADVGVGAEERAERSVVA